MESPETPQSTQGLPRPGEMMRTASSEGAILRHPAPDLQSIQGAYVGNIERLEQTAERMSATSSEVGEELPMPGPLGTSSRPGSSGGGGAGRGPPPPYTRSRQESTSSHAQSIVDINSTARWGGYSPGGYISSPPGSGMSGSWSHVSQGSVLGLQTQMSGSASGAGQSQSQPNSAGPASRSYKSSLNRIAVPATDADGESQLPTPQAFPPRGASLARTGELPRMRSPGLDVLDDLLLENSAVAERVSDVPDSAQINRQSIRSDNLLAEHLQLGDLQPLDDDGLDRPTTAASGDTYRQARSLFRDFDGVHYSPQLATVPSLGALSIQTRLTEQQRASASVIRALPPLEPTGPPPPQEGMVYYPAPVPKMLNLPQRISRLPAASVQAKRRSQMLNNLPPDNRKSAVWLNDRRQSAYLALNGDETSPQKPQPSPDQASPGDGTRSPLSKKRGEDEKITPHLRAQMFFEHEPVRHDVQIQHNSAVDTLDSILEASATAPVSAFVDHPFAGKVGNEVYGKDKGPRKSTANLAAPQKKAARRRRSSTNLLMRKSSMGSETLSKMHQRSSSRLSVMTSSKAKTEVAVVDGGEDDEEEDLSESKPLRQSLDDRDRVRMGEGEGEDDEHDASEDEYDIAPDDDEMDEEGEYSEEDEDEEGEEEEDEDDEDAFIGPPTTLLAELQLRKQHLKSRNRTAATAFPNGMHSTLLEMDAVAQVQKNRRQHQRVALAWEDHGAAKGLGDDADDDDIPLAVLYPERTGLAKKAGAGGNDWDRPLGLLEQKNLEDNEPLSSRRTRLFGPAKAGLASPNNLHANAAEGDESEQDDEHEGETLAQRKRRLADREKLDSTIRDVSGSRPLSGSFAADLISQFGGAEETDKNEEGRKTPEPVDPENETLGQRRARLQREAKQTTSSPRNRDTRTLDQLTGSPGNRMSSVLSNLGPATGATGNTTAPPVRAQRSMADLLAANPLSSARALQQTMLGNFPSDSHLPSKQPQQGTLLHAVDREKEQHRTQIAERNALAAATSAKEKPLVDVRAAADPFRNVGKSKGFKGGVFNNGYAGVYGMGGDPIHHASSSPNLLQQQQMAMGMGMPTMGMPMGMGTDMNAMSPGGYFGQNFGSGIGGGAAFATTPMEQQQQQQQQQMMMMQAQQQQQQMGAMYPMGMQMGMPMMVPGMGPPQQRSNFPPSLPRQRSYAHLSQAEVGGGGGGPGGMSPGGGGIGGGGMSMQDLAAMDPKQRDLIDRWRQSIM